MATAQTLTFDYVAKQDLLKVSIFLPKSEVALIRECVTPTNLLAKAFLLTKLLS
jgi:hypothetical protein